jgi:3-hydroxyisobutyrate dehydrogenase
MAKLGFIGLGAMGAPMAANLLRAGHSVKVYDLNSAAYAPLVAAGGLTAASALEAATGVDVVVTMLPNGPIVEATYLGEGGLIPNLVTRPLLIDSSTVGAETSRKVAQAAAERGFVAIDAPVSGGVMGAHAATLSFIVGGSAEALEQARPVLAAMGHHIFHAGDSGAGQMAKICNNMLAMVLLAGTAEALALGVRNGLDPKALSEIVLHSTGSNFMVEKYNPWPGVDANAPASRGYEGGFQVALMLKDLGLALASAQAVGAATPMGATARNLLALQGAKGPEALHRDMSSIQQLYAPWVGADT